MTQQLPLDLWGNGADRPSDPHQQGQVRLPYDTAGLGKTGDLVDAWICCRCGRPELTRYWLGLNHGCCGTNLLQECRRPYPIDFRPHWIPPSKGATR